MKIRGILALSAVMTVPFGLAPACAQEKQKLSFKIGAESTKYTQQHEIEVGDIPGHKIRLFEIRREYSKGTAKIEGVDITEAWTRAFSDYIDLNGAAKIYGIYVLENGDRIFSRGDLVSQTVANADGSRNTTSTSVSQITGGTGKFVNIKGNLKSLTHSDIKAGVNENQTELEYWLSK